MKGIRYTTSLERHEARYKRRQAKRLERLRERNDEIGGIDKAFGFRTMFYYGRKSCNGVRWKHSTQNFERHLFSTTARSIALIRAGKWRPAQGKHFTIYERGKIREIDAPTIADRQIEKCFTQNVLLPLYKPYTIFNNGASLKGKGFHFSQRQLNADLREHFKRYGANGYILLVDIRKFFPSASHEVIRNMHKRYILDDGLRSVADKMLEHGTEGVERGQALGVESSQAEMVHYLSPLDHFVTCQLGYKGYGHYMDDIYILLPPDRSPAAVRDAVAEFCNQALDIEVNVGKTFWVGIDRPFRYCKIKHWRDKKSGKIKMLGSHDCLPRARHKILAFHNKKLPLEYVRMSLWSTMAYLEHFDDNNRRHTLLSVFAKNFHIKWNDLWAFRQ